MNLLTTQLPVMSTNTNLNYFGFFRVAKQEPTLRQLRRDIDSIMPLTIVDADGLSHTVFAKHTERNTIVDCYFNTPYKDNEFLYFWAEVNDKHIIQQWHFIRLPIEMSVLQPILSTLKHTAYFVRLLDLFISFQTSALRQFCWDLFNDPTLMQLLVTLPASKNHHHSFEGGLLLHSLECAYLTYKNLEVIQEMKQSEKELTVLAALLHDIGKIKTLGQKQHTPIGQLMDHEKFTLVMLAYPLMQLQHCWPQGAVTLQYLLTWNQKDGFCKFIGGNIIKSADHLSTSISIRKMAFEDKPNHYSFGQVKTGKAVHYVNRIA